MNDNSLVIHTDGGSRGNPGPAASAFVVENNGKKIFEGSKYLGKTTNNVAEYQGVIIALDWLLSSKEINVSSITFILDSELIVKQINGSYKVKDENLKKLYIEVKSLIGKIDQKIIFKNVLRNENKEADFLVNMELDRQ
ncbi:MAG TPA: ribonuclease HI family protein [Patescibacteria group bacterium]|nr:ribonuclease HI family protein [Patescibacteria group bacterium]